MPVKLNSKLPENAEARIEIIPLIDVMFFLLAAFMLVSLSMVNLRAVKVNLPAAASASDETKKDQLDISITADGLAYLEKQRVDDDELSRQLARARAANSNLRIIISGDSNARHGDVIHILDIVRSCGIYKVAFETLPQRNSP